MRKVHAGAAQGAAEQAWLTLWKAVLDVALLQWNGIHVLQACQGGAGVGVERRRMQAQAQAHGPAWRRQARGLFRACGPPASQTVGSAHLKPKLSADSQPPHLEAEVVV